MLSRQQVGHCGSAAFPLFFGIMKRLVPLLAFALLPFAVLTAQTAAPAPASPAVAVSNETQNVTPAEAEKLLKEKKEIVVLDVRTADEFAEGHIPGAKNIDFLSGDFAKKAAELDPSKTYLIHCAAGGRSSKAVSCLKDQKFTGTVYHLNSGFKEWQKEGKPVEK